MTASLDDRIGDLRALRDDLKARMGDCGSDQNFAVMGRLLVEVLEQIEELAGDSAPEERTGLSEFEKKLAERTAPSRSGRAKSV